MTEKTGEIRLCKETERKKKKNKSGKNGNFLSGVMILSLSTVIVKIIGLVYKIPMLRLLGSEGMGYFNSAYELYALFCVISTSGIPVATVAIDGAANAAHLAAEILALSDESLREKLIATRAAGSAKVLEKNAAIEAQFNK